MRAHRAGLGWFVGRPWVEDRTSTVVGCGGSTDDVRPARAGGRPGPDRVRRDRHLHARSGSRPPRRARRRAGHGTRIAGGRAGLPTPRDPRGGTPRGRAPDHVCRARRGRRPFPQRSPRRGASRARPRPSGRYRRGTGAGVAHARRRTLRGCNTPPIGGARDHPDRERGDADRRRGRGPRGPGARGDVGTRLAHHQQTRRRRHRRRPAADG